MKHLLKFFVIVFFCCIGSLVATAQQKHFIYVQSGDRQPFAVVLNGKVYSSSDYGYVIVPNLADGDYTFRVSFPMNKFADQSFTCTINKKDAGYLLKTGDDGVWVLQNMQTQKVIANSTAAVAQKNAFGDMLSDVVSDSTLTKNTVNEPNDKVAGVAAGAAAVLAVTDTSANNTGFITDSIAQLEKISEAHADTGTNMLFVDKTQTGTDTISVFIPTENDVSSTAGTPENPVTDKKEEAAVAAIAAGTNAPDTKINAPGENAVNEKKEDTSLSVAENSNNNPVTENNNASGTGVVENNSASKTDEALTIAAASNAKDASNPFYKPDTTSNAAVSTGSDSINQNTTTQTITGIKQDCIKMLTDGEFDKLKRKMFVQSNSNDMVQYALKAINKKCITTEQVKVLGGLFQSDDGRYNFYDAMYIYVYDYGNYPTLAGQILDPYYKKRFAVMLR